MAITHCRAGLGPPVAAPDHPFHLVWTTFSVWTTFFPPYIEIWDHLRFSVGGHPGQEEAVCGKEVHWGVASESFPVLVPLVRFDDLRVPMMEGLVVTIGGLDPHLSKVASTALVAYLRSPSHLSHQAQVRSELGLVTFSNL